MMPHTLQVALVGYGMAGKIFHAPLIAATAGLELACMVSSDAAKVHADYPGVLVVADLASALALPQIDLVVLASPDHLHAEQALACLAAGKHLVIDKPFAPTFAEAQTVAARAAELGLTLSIFQNRRWDADFLTVKALIADGTLGEIRQFESHFDRYKAAPSDKWKDRRQFGVLQDLGPHLVDQALHLFGMPDTVYADLGVQTPDGPALDYAHVLLRYGACRVILHMSQATMDSGLRFAVHGTKASYIKYGLDAQEAQSKAGMHPEDPAWGIDPIVGHLTQIAADGTVTKTAQPSVKGNSLAYYASVRDAILQATPPPVTAQEALNVMALLEAARLSAAAGREVIPA